MDWEPFRVLNNFRCQIDIKIRPVIMARRRLLDMEDRFHWLILKPWEFFIGDKKLFIVSKEPHPVT